MAAVSPATKRGVMTRPAEADSGPGFSPALLRTRLSAVLKSNGTVDALKSQLRAKVLSELRAGSGAAGSGQHARSVVEQAANLLIMDYLQGAGYHYTASVFAPESGVPAAPTAALSDSEFLQETHRVLELLHIHPDSRLYRQMTSVRSSSAFRTLLEYLTHSAHHAPGVTNTACQTATDEAHTIERKMELINERYRGLAHENAMAPIKTLEERLAQCQRDADARIRAEVEEAVTRVRKVEMSKMRLEEQAKYSQQLAQVREEMESTWQKRLEALRQREAEFNEKLSKKEADVEHQLYAHRQRMLSDMEVIRRRDAESRKQAEDGQQHIARQDMRCRELERDFEVKLAQLDKERSDLSREREVELSRIRADMLRLREEEQRELASQRREVEEQRLQLQIARDSFGDAMAEARLARDECVELKAENKRQALELETLRAEVQRKVERCAEKEEECQRLDDEAKRLQERMAELEAARRELAGSYLGDSIADTPHSRRSSRKSGAGGAAASPAKSHSAAAAFVVDQLEDLRASHGRERVIKEKQLIQAQSELKRAGREILVLQQRLSDIQREYDLCQARLRESETALLGCNKELSEVKLQVKMAKQEAEDTRNLLQQSQLALDRDRRRAVDDEAVKNILGAPVLFGRRPRNENFESQRQLLESIAPFVSGGSSATTDSAGAWDRGGGSNHREQGDGAWEMELNRLLSTIGELEKEDHQLRTQRESLLASQRHERLMRDFPQTRPALPDRPPVTYAWGAGEARDTRVAQVSAPIVSYLPTAAQEAAGADTAAITSLLSIASSSVARQHASSMAGERAEDDHDMSASEGWAAPPMVTPPGEEALAFDHGNAERRISSTGAHDGNDQATLLPIRQSPSFTMVQNDCPSETEAVSRREGVTIEEAEQRARQREEQMQSEQRRRQDEEQRRRQEEEETRREREKNEHNAREAHEEELRRERELAETRVRQERELLDKQRRDREEDEKLKERQQTEEKEAREKREREAAEKEEMARHEREEQARLAREEEMRRSEEERMRKEEEEERKREEERLQEEERKREEQEQQVKEEKRQAEEERRREEERQKREEQEKQKEEERQKREEEEKQKEEDRQKRKEEEKQKEADRQRLAEENARAEEAKREAQKKQDEEIALLEQLRRDQEESARLKREEEARRKEAETEKERKRELEEASRRQEEEERQRNLEREQEQHKQEVARLLEEGTQAARAGKLEEAQQRYTEAKNVLKNLPQTPALAAQVEGLHRVIEDSRQERIKDEVLELIEDARRELGLHGGEKDEVGRAQVAKAHEHVQESRKMLDQLDAGARDELLEEVEAVEEEISAADGRIAAKEAAEKSKEEEAAKAGNVMDLYRQMLEGGGSGGGSGGSGSSGGAGESPDRSAGSIVEDFEFDEVVSGSGSGSGWGQQDAGDDEDDW